MRPLRALARTIIVISKHIKLIKVRPCQVWECKDARYRARPTIDDMRRHGPPVEMVLQLSNGI